MKTVWDPPLLHQWVRRLQAPYRHGTTRRRHTAYADDRKQTHQSTDADHTARASHPRLFHNDDHARSGDRPLDQPLRVWTTHLMQDPQLCNTFRGSSIEQSTNLPILSTLYEPLPKPLTAVEGSVSYPPKEGSTSFANSCICRLISSIRSSRNSRTSRKEHTRWCTPASSNASTIWATVLTEPLRSL